jgi:Domain of unknown function (DUF4342)
VVRKRRRLAAIESGLAVVRGALEFGETRLVKQVAGSDTLRQNMPDFNVVYEEIKVRGKELVDKVGELIREGNVRRIIVKDEKGNTFVEIPLTIATVGVIAAPVLAALGTIAALIAHFTLVVEKAEPPAGEHDSETP